MFKPQVIKEMQIQQNQTQVENKSVTEANEVYPVYKERENLWNKIK